MHPKLKKYYVPGNKKCDLKECGNWVSCGPNCNCVYHRCIPIDMIPTTPCELCGFWSGEGMKDWEIENLVVMLENISGEKE